MDFHFLFTTYQSTTLSALLYYVPSVYIFYDTVLCKSKYGVLYFVDSSARCNTCQERCYASKYIYINYVTIFYGRTRRQFDPPFCFSRYILIITCTACACP
jgi:hypothetical protein